MQRNGFTLVELMVVVAIVGILLSISTLQFNKYTMKTNIEKQVQTLYADLMNARAQSFMLRSSLTATVNSATLMTISGAGTPTQQTTFRYPVSADAAFPCAVSFDTRGVASTALTICTGTAGNPAAVDSIVVTATMIQLGKWKGGACTSDQVTPK